MRPEPDPPPNNINQDLSVSVLICLKLAICALNWSIGMVYAGDNFFNFLWLHKLLAECLLSKLCELKYRQYKHEICKMRYKRNKFIAKYQVLKSEMGQIPMCALP